MTDDTRPAEDVVHDLLPLHGPYSREQAVRAGWLIDELFRYLNYACAEPAGIEYPIAAYELFGALNTAADKLPQLFEQVGYRLDTLKTDPNMVNKDLDYRTPEGAVAAHADAVVRAEHAKTQLQQAARAARQLAISLADAQGALSPVGMNIQFDHGGVEQ